MTITASAPHPDHRRTSRSHAEPLAGRRHLLPAHLRVLDPGPDPDRARAQRRGLRDQRRQRHPRAVGLPPRLRERPDGGRLRRGGVLGGEAPERLDGPRLRHLPPRGGRRGHDRCRQPARGRHDAPGLRRLRCRRCVGDRDRQRPGRRPQLDLPVRARPDARLQRGAVRHSPLQVPPGAPHHPDRRPDRCASAVRRLHRRPVRCHRPGLGHRLLPDPAAGGVGALGRPLDDLQGLQPLGRLGP